MTDDIANNETPDWNLKTHDLTRRLTNLKVTEEQLQAMRFRETNKGWPFDQWSYEWPETVPPDAIPLVKPYCTLKWLLRENPSHSRDTEDAWRYVNEEMIAPIIKIGLKTVDAQRERAKKPRGKMDGGNTLGQMIRELALNPTYRDLTAKELWPHLFSALERQTYTEVDETHSDTSKWRYTYCFQDHTRTISFGRFANIVAASRRRKNHDSRAQ